MDNLDLVEPDESRDKHLLEMILIRGWKGDKSSTLSEARALDGSHPNSQQTALMVAKSRQMFLEHHVDIPPGQVTPDEIGMAINSWIALTFHREWRLAASDMDPGYFPHGPKDALQADPDDPLDPLHSLPLSSPQYLPGNLCATKNCTYLAYVHIRCAACCHVKYKVEVKRSTGGDGGLGLFATTRLVGRTSRNAVLEPWDLHRVSETEFIINFCTDLSYLQDDHCTHPPSLQYYSLLKMMLLISTLILFGISTRINQGFKSTSNAMQQKLHPELVTIPPDSDATLLLARDGVIQSS